MAADLTAELEQLHAAAFGWALSCCGWDRSAAEDVLQASYLKLLDGRARFDGRSSLRTFVFGVIARTAREVRRRAALRRWLPLASLLLGPEPVDGRPDPATALVGADETARLMRALGRLSARQRQVLHLVFYEDLTIAEAAAVAGVSLGTARTHYERGKAALKKLLEEEPERSSATISTSSRPSRRCAGNMRPAARRSRRPSLRHALAGPTYRDAAPWGSPPQ